MKNVAHVSSKRIKIASIKLVVYVKIVALKRFHATYVMLI